MQHIKRIIFLIEALSEWSGRIVAWLVLVMALVVGYDVIMRYLFHSGSVALQEVEWHLFALIFLLGSAYTFKHDSHVRVDIFYNSHWMNDRRRAWLDLFGGLFLLAPFCLLVIISSFSFVENSYLMGESSPDPGGLPWRYLLKAAIPVGFILIFLQGIAHMLRCVISLMCEEA